MRISVLTITDRDICFIQQVASLKAQSFQDFEWILVDDYCDKRREEYARLVDGKFSFVHIPPKNVVNHFAPGAATNDGLIHCSGEIIYFMADYMMPSILTLGRCWEVHQKYPRAMVSGYSLEVDCLPAQLTNGVIKGRDYRMSLFQQGQFKWSDIESGIKEVYRDGVQNFWFGRNDSAPLKDMLDCNGFDEQYDGGYGYHDDDFAQRLMTYGLRYIIDLQSIALFFTHEKCKKIQLRDQIGQQWFKDKLIPARIQQSITQANPHRNLRKEREECLRLSA